MAWPALWKKETVIAISKNSSPANLSELRNLSCTPLFSKILESFVLDRIKGEIELSSRQFGGIKGCGTDHFLLETWDAIIKALEDGDTAANLLSVDFEKAFNRMDHRECLFALSELGASETTTDWVASFLYGRNMTVRIKSSYSAPRPVPGGSPQGSILGNLLFCATTNKFADIDVERDGVVVTDSSSDSSDTEQFYEANESISSDSSTEFFDATDAVSSTPLVRGQFATFRPPRCLLNLSGEYQSDEEEFDFFRVRRRHSFDTSTEDEPSISFQVPNTICHVPVKTMVYIDDYNSIEKIRILEAESHISTRKRILNVLAQKSERVFAGVQSLADSIKMRVNSKKTQMLCIHANHCNIVNSYIKTSNQGQKIESGKSLKILDFNFNSEPNAVFHVLGVIDKLYGKLWTLRFLKQSGMEKMPLLGIYKNVLRPSVEYSSIIYHSLIPEYVASRLETVQKQAMKIIFGWDVDYQSLLENGTIETLKDRRIEGALRFALKASISPRFGPTWFRETPSNIREVRPTTRLKYLEPLCRTERSRNNPIAFMTRLLNEHYNEQLASRQEQ